MPENDDMQLLRQFTGQGSQEAFTALVRRHINLVYSVALRHVRDVQQAEDITQAVFIVLAQKAARLSRETILSGWLYQTTRFASASTLRREQRRQQREQESFMQAQIENEPIEATWERLAPALDDAMARLGSKERDAIVLRFFQDKPVTDVARALGVSQPAAKKRVTRGLEKLRHFFAKRGVAVSVGALGAALGAGSVQAAPSGLAATASTLALTKGASASLSIATVTQGTLKLMAWTRFKAIASLSAGVLLAVGTVTTAITVASSTPGAATRDLQGAWAVSPDGGMTKMDLVLNISRRQNNYHATADLPDLGLKGVAVDKFTYRYPAIHIEKKDIGLVYDATVNADGEQMSGTATWKGQTGPVTLKRTATPANTPDSLDEGDYRRRAGSDVQGYWKGALQAGSASYPVILKLAEPTNGMFRAEWSSVERGVKDLPASTISYQDSNLKITFAGIGAVYEGVVDRSRSQITGTWKVRGQTFSITLNQADPRDDLIDEAQNNYSFSASTELQGHWYGTLNGN
jgi:RNA polymerase sigma factor (sigma-70 family)